MTLNEFFTVLEQALRADPVALPHVTNQGTLRIERRTIFYYCPLTYLAQRLGKGEFTTAQSQEVAAVLAIRPRTMRRLIDAADGLTENQTRQRLEVLWTLPWLS